MTQFSFIIIKWSLKKAQGFTKFLRNNLECFFTTTLIKGSVPYSFAQFVSILKHLHDNCRTFQRSTSLCWTNIMTQHCRQFIGTFFKSCNCSAWRAVLETRNNNKMQFSAWHSYIFFFVQCKRTQIKRWHTLFDEP